MTAPRIIAGSLKGRRLDVPEGDAVRPTAARMREALFNILGADVEEARFLDLFAGSGAIGLEALSRGAASVTLIESDAEIERALRASIQRLGVAKAARSIRGDACRLGHAHDVFDIVYADPPYGSDLLPRTLASLRDGGWVDDDSLIIAELGAREPLAPATGYTLEDERRYGAGRLLFLRLG